MSQATQGVWSVAEKKVKFRGIFREIREKIGWYRGNFVEIFGTNFAEKQQVKTADFVEFSGQISLEIDRFCTDLTSVFKVF